MPVPTTPTDVLITADRAKLPPAVAALLDPAVPVPFDVAFFEARVTAGSVALAAGGAVAAGLVGVVCLPIGVVVLVHPGGPVTVSSRADTFLLGVGAVALLIAWVLVVTVRDRLRLLAAQRAGRPTRFGVFVQPDAVVEAGDSAVTFIPRSQVLGVADRTVRYRFNGQDKALRLPDRLVRRAASELDAAVARWAGNAAHP